MLAWGSLSCCFQLGFVWPGGGVSGGGMEVPPGRAYVGWEVPAINWLRHWTMGHLDDTKDSAGHWNSSRGASIAKLPELVRRS
jgi:hypothetical protein